MDKLQRIRQVVEEAEDIIRKLLKYQRMSGVDTDTSLHGRAERFLRDLDEPTGEPDKGGDSSSAPREWDNDIAYREGFADGKAAQEPTGCTCKEDSPTKDMGGFSAQVDPDCPEHSKDFSNPEHRREAAEIAAKEANEEQSKFMEQHKKPCTCGEPHISDRITHCYGGKPCYVTDSVEAAEKKECTCPLIAVSPTESERVIALYCPRHGKVKPLDEEQG